MGFTVFLTASSLAAFSAFAESGARTVYEIKKPPSPYTELPIAKGTLSSKIFTDSLVLEEGDEKLQYLSAEKREEAKRKAILMAKKEEPKKPTPKPVEITKKEDYPSGTIILLDKTVIKPDQKEVNIAATSKKSPTKKVAKTNKKPAVKSASSSTSKVHIAYIADESEVLGNTRKKLLQFVRNLRNHGNAKVKVTTASVPLPLQEEDMLAENRIKYIKAFMREQGINPAHYEFIPTHKKSKKLSDQYLQLELLS